MRIGSKKTNKVLGLTWRTVNSIYELHQPVCRMMKHEMRGTMKSIISFSAVAVFLLLALAASAQTPPAATPSPAPSPAPSPDAAPPSSAAPVPVTVGTDADRDTNPAPDKMQSAEVPTNELKLRQLAELVEDLKNKVTATKFRLQLLKEAMTAEKETIGGAKITIRHINKMGGAFKMVRLRYMMDGKLIASYSDAGEKDREVLSRKEITIPVGHVSPGNVRFTVFITYQGNGYGVFKYVKEWKWEVNNSYSFAVNPGMDYVLEVQGVEKGGWTTPLDQRPAISFQLKTQALVNKEAAKPKSK